MKVDDYGSVLRSARSCFDDANPLLELGLGLRAASLRLDRLLDAYASEMHLGADDRLVSDSAGVDFLLGVIALRDRLETLFAAPEPSALTVSTPDLSNDSGDSLLR